MPLTALWLDHHRLVFINMNIIYISIWPSIFKSNQWNCMKWTLFFCCCYSIFCVVGFTRTCAVPSKMFSGNSGFQMITRWTFCTENGRLGLDMFVDFWLFKHSTQFIPCPYFIGKSTTQHHDNIKRFEFEFEQWVVKYIDEFPHACDWTRYKSTTRMILAFSRNYQTVICI